MPATARLGDPISCGDTIAGGSGNVFANSMPIARLGDGTGGHPCGPPTSLSAGNDGNVFANNISISVVGSAISSHGTCDDPPHDGNVSVGSPDVYCGGSSGGANSISLDEASVEFYSSIGSESRQSGITAYDAASHDTDDEGAPSDTGGNAPISTTPVPLSNNQIRVAAGAKKDNVDISTPPNVVATAPVAPAPSAPPIGGYTYADIDSTQSFVGSFQLSPSFTLAMLTTNTRVSNYPIRSQTTNGRVYSEKDLVKNLRDLCYNILEPLKILYPTIAINSAFRHTSNGKSQHERGQAADVSMPATNTDSNAAWVVAQAIANSTLPYDQFIFEQNNSIWFHLSYDKSRPAQRRMVMSKPRGQTNPTIGLNRVL